MSGKEPVVTGDGANTLASTAGIPVAKTVNTVIPINVVCGDEPIISGAQKGAVTLDPNLDTMISLAGLKAKVSEIAYTVC